MPYRTTPLVNDYFYHVFNRGVEKRNIFTNNSDRIRFIKALRYYQIIGPKPRFSKYNPQVHKNLNSEKIMDVIAYCLMPNHFHFLVKQISNNGVSEFFSKVGNSYTKYFNIKYRRVGFLFQGAFKAVLVENEEQLIHLSRYIHLNPYVSGLVKDPKEYKWSSYQEIVNLTNNSWVKKEEILNCFPSAKAYEEFVSDHQDYAKNLALIKHQMLEEE